MVEGVVVEDDEEENEGIMVEGLVVEVDCCEDGCWDWFWGGGNVGWKDGVVCVGLTGLGGLREDVEEDVEGIEEIDWLNVFVEKFVENGWGVVEIVGWAGLAALVVCWWTGR